MLYGDVNGISTPFQGYLLVPDYTHTKTVIYHDYATLIDIGDTIHKHLDHTYCCYTDTAPTGAPDPKNYAMSYIIPAHGFVKVGGLFGAAPNTYGCGFFVLVEREHHVTSVFSSTNNNLNAGMFFPTTLIPVRKDDIIYWGTGKSYARQTIMEIPATYRIDFIYALKETT